MSKTSFPFLKAILKAIKESIIIADNDSKIFYVNNEFSRTFGYEFEEVLGKDLNFLFSRDYQDTKTQQIDWFSGSSQQGLVGRKSQIVVIHKKGFTFNSNLKVIESTNEIGERYFILSLQPNLSIPLKSGSRSKSGDNLKNLHTEKMGSWEWNLINDQVNWSEELYQILGLENNQIEASFWNYFGFVYTPDKKFVTKAVLESLRSYKSFKLIHRIVKEDSKISIVQVIGASVQEGNAKPTSMVGTLHDITEEIERVRRVMTLSKVFENSEEAIVITDEHNQIIEINAAFSTITGYQLHEVEGKNPGVLKSGKHDKDFYTKMWSSITKEGEWKGEVWDRRKNGEIYPKYLVISSFIDESANAVRYIGVFSDLSKEKREMARLRDLAFFDPLTGLCNRSYAIELLIQELKYCRRNQLSVAVCFLDLDNFKAVNDTQGHAAGDQLLSMTADLMRDQFRESDIIARFGGDEFVIVLKDLKEEDDINLLLNKFIDKIPALGKKWNIPITCSVGVSQFPQDGDNAETLLARADLAMYASKAKGKGCHTLYQISMEDSLPKGN